VADGRDDRDGTGKDRARHGLIVEGRQVLQGSSAPGDDDDVNVFHFLQKPQRGRNFPRRLRSLHAHGRNQDIDGRETPSRHREDVPDHGPRGRRDDADPGRQKRNRFLFPGVEKPLGREPRFELFEGLLQRAKALGLDPLDNQLVLAPRLVHPQPSAAHDPHALFQFERRKRRGARPAEGGEARPEQNGADGALVVLEREIDMARSRAPQIRDLALHLHDVEPRFQKIADFFRKLGNG